MKLSQILPNFLAVIRKVLPDDFHESSGIFQHDVSVSFLLFLQNCSESKYCPSTLLGDDHPIVYVGIRVVEVRFPVALIHIKRGL